MEFKGEFLGFTYGGIHSSELGMVRTSNGFTRKQLIPNVLALTTEKPNQDGTYFWGATPSNKNFSIEFAFDKITEEQLHKIKKLFTSRDLQELIFDEEPHKVYMAKPNNLATIESITFDLQEKRLHSGSGSIEFVTYTPFARSKKEFIENYSKQEGFSWRAASGLPSYEEADISSKLAIGFIEPSEEALLENQGVQIFQNNQDYEAYGTIDFSNFTSSFVVKNNSNFEVPFTFFIEELNLEKPLKLTLKKKQGADWVDVEVLELEPVFTRQVTVDTKNQFIIDKNNILLNGMIKEGNFFNFPIGTSWLTSNIPGILEYHYLYI